MNKEALLEALKELGRYLLFAAVGWVVAYLGGLEQTQTVMLVTMLFRFLDKFLHERFKDRGEGLSGIAPF